MPAYVPGADTQAVIDAIEAAATRICSTIDIVGKRVERQLRTNDEGVRTLLQVTTTEVADTHLVLVNMVRELVSDGEEREAECSAEYDNQH